MPNPSQFAASVLTADTTEDVVDSFVDSMMLAAQANTVRLIADAQDGHAVVHAFKGGVLWTFREEPARQAAKGLADAARMLGNADLRSLAKRLHAKINEAVVLRGARAD